jgi:hypothetical protein
VGKTRGRWENAVWSDAVDLRQVRNFKAIARGREFWRKTIMEDVAQKWAKVSLNDKKKEEEKEQKKEKKKKKMMMKMMMTTTYIP